MRLRKGLAACLVVFLLTVAEIEATEETSEEIKEEVVISLDNSNFTEVVSKHHFILVLFYLPECMHCRKLAPEYEEAASILRNHDPPITLAKINVTVEGVRDLARKLGVESVPTLKILRNGGEIVQKYRGPREADGIVKYIKKQLGPPIVEIKSTDAAASLIHQDKPFIAGVFPEFSGEEFENFTTLANIMQSEYDFGYTSDAKVLPRGDSSVTGPLIRLFKPFDELFVDFKDFNLDAMLKFIEEEDSPVVLLNDQDPISEVYINKFANKSTRVTMLLNFSSENAEVLKSKFYDIAYLLKGGNLGFRIGDIDSSSQSLLQRLKLDKSRAPLIFILEDGKKKYLKANLESDEMVPWFKKFLDGKVKPCNISQPIPQENNEPVKIVVLDSLEDMVFNSGKEVLLNIYAPWCVHCKTLAPILEEVAAFYANDTNITIAKFDATLNDMPRSIFELKHYPTMYLVSTIGMKIFEYDNAKGYEKEALIAFIEGKRGDRERTDQENENQIEIKYENDSEEKSNNIEEQESNAIETDTEEKDNDIHEQEDKQNLIKDE